MMGNVQELVGDGNAYINNSTIPEVKDYASALYVDPRGPTAECAERIAAVTTEYTGAIAARDGNWEANASSMLVYQRAAYGRSENNKFRTLGIRLCVTCD